VFSDAPERIPLRARCAALWGPSHFIQAGGWLCLNTIMLKRETIAIDAIYVPIKRRATLKSE